MALSLDEDDRSQIAKILAEVPLFASLGNKRIRTIASSFARKRYYDAGEVIEKEGDNPVVFYLITDGSVEVRRGEKTLSKLGPGKFFGEMALIDKQPRSATVVAAQPTKCLLMPVWNFRAALETDPKAAMGVMRELARRLRQTTNALSE